MATYTQVETNGLFELSEEARAELSSSSYYNEDLKPTTVAERKWTTYNITMLWVGMSICIPSLSLASGLIGMGVSPWLSVLNVALGNIAILIPIQLNSNVGTKYGIPFPLFARLTFGSIGAQIPALLRALTACGWCSVQAWVGGGAVGAIIGVFISKFADQNWMMSLPSWGGMAPVMVGQFIGYIIFMFFIWWVAYHGMDRIKFIQNWGGPILIAVMMVLLLTGFVGSESGSNKESPGSEMPGSSESGAQSGELLSGRERNSQEGLLKAVMLYGHYSNQYSTSIGTADERINQSLENLNHSR